MILDKLKNNLIDKKYYEYSIVEEGKLVFIYLKLNCYIMPFSIGDTNLTYDWKNHNSLCEFRIHGYIFYFGFLDFNNEYIYFISKKEFYFEQNKQNIIYFFEHILYNAKKDNSGFVFEEKIKEN